MQRLAIIADDLTGASDSGVQFARRGLHTQVIFDWTELSSDPLESIVIDTDSRSVPGEEAYARVRSAAECLKKQGYDFIYKKLDSTLRGNLGREVDAVLDVYDFEAAIIVPAFPRIGRTTVNGVHYLNGVPINETEMARDPKTPVPEAQIARLLSAQSVRKSVCIELSALRSGTEPVRRRILEALAQRIPLIVIDAETDEDMRRIGELVPEYRNRFLWVGSAGLAEYLPVQVSAQKPQRPQRDSNKRSPVMLVAGSTSKITREQVAAVNGDPGMTSVELNPIALVQSPQSRDAETERCFKELTAGLEQGRDISLHAGSSPDQVQSAKQLGAQIGLDPSGVSNRIADTLGEIAAKIVARYRIGGLVLTGGDTAKAVCRHLGVRGIELVAELETGIPLGRLLGAGNLMAVTKAGAFGRKESLLQAMHLLKGETAIA